MDQKLLEILMPIFITISGGVATIIGMYFALANKKLQKQLEQLDNDADKEFAFTVLKNVDEAVQSAVVFTNQTFVDAIKSSSADGKLTPEEITESFKRTYNKTLELMGSQLYADASKLKPDFNNWLTTRIECFVNQHK